MAASLELRGASPAVQLTGPDGAARRAGSTDSAMDSASARVRANTTSWNNRGFAPFTQ